MTLSTGGFRQVVAFPPAPIATGWSDPCREGLAPSQEPCLSTAHDFITTTFGFRFSVHTGAGEGAAATDRERHGLDGASDPRGGVVVCLVSAAVSAGADSGQPGHSSRPRDAGRLGEACRMVAQEPL